jgi:hypothetical protein
LHADDRQGVGQQAVEHVVKNCPLIPISILLLTKTQMEKLANAVLEAKGVRIQLSETQLEYNKQIEGGFIGSVIAGLPSAALHSLASLIMDKISGKGLYLKRGDSLVKLKQLRYG